MQKSCWQRIVMGLLVVGFLPSIVMGQYTGTKRGTQHIDFTLPSIEDEKPISLSQYRGKKVFLIHFASW